MKEGYRDIDEALSAHLFEDHDAEDLRPDDLEPIPDELLLEGSPDEHYPELQMAMYRYRTGDKEGFDEMIGSLLSVADDEEALYDWGLLPEDMGQMRPLLSMLTDGSYQALLALEEGFLQLVQDEREPRKEDLEAVLGEVELLGEASGPGGPFGELCRALVTELRGIIDLDLEHEAGRAEKELRSAFEMYLGLGDHQRASRTMGELLVVRANLDRDGLIEDGFEPKGDLGLEYQDVWDQPLAAADPFNDLLVLTTAYMRRKAAEEYIQAQVAGYSHMSMRRTPLGTEVNIWVDRVKGISQDLLNEITEQLEERFGFPLPQVKFVGV